MRPRATSRVARGLAAFALGIVFAWLLVRGHLFRELRPIPWPGGADLGIGLKDVLFIALGLALAVWVLLPTDPVRRGIRTSGLIIFLAGYGFTNVDWMFLLKGIYLSHGGFPSVLELVMLAAPLVIVLAFLLIHRGASLAAMYRERGVPEAECDAITRGVWAGGIGVLAHAIIAWAAVVLAVMLLQGPARDLQFLRAIVGIALAAASVALVLAIMARAKGRRLKLIDRSRVVDALRETRPEP